jgi:hypothetical protein
VQHQARCIIENELLRSSPEPEEEARGTCIWSPTKGGRKPKPSEKASRVQNGHEAEGESAVREVHQNDGLTYDIDVYYVKKDRSVHGRGYAFLWTSMLFLVVL